MKRALGILALVASSLSADTFTFNFAPGGNATTGIRYNSVTKVLATLANGIKISNFDAFSPAAPTGNFNGSSVPSWTSGAFHLTSAAGSFNLATRTWSFPSATLSIAGTFGAIATGTLFNATIGSFTLSQQSGASPNSKTISLDSPVPSITLTPTAQGNLFLSYFGLNAAALDGSIFSLLSFAPNSGVPNSGAFTSSGNKSLAGNAGINAVPEPSTMLFLSSGLGLVLIARVMRGRLGSRA